MGTCGDTAQCLERVCGGRRSVDRRLAVAAGHLYGCDRCPCGLLIDPVIAIDWPLSLRGQGALAPRDTGSGMHRLSHLQCLSRLGLSVPPCSVCPTHALSAPPCSVCSTHALSVPPALSVSPCSVCPTLHSVPPYSVCPTLHSVPPCTLCPTQQCTSHNALCPSMQCMFNRAGSALAAVSVSPCSVCRTMSVP